MSTTVTKLCRHIDVIMVRPVMLPIAGIVVGYWRNGCSYRNIAREVGLHSNTVYAIIKRFCERGNFVCGRCTRRPRKTNDRDDRMLYRLSMVNRRFSVQRLRHAWQPNVNYVVSRQTVNMRLVARSYMARRMVKVPRLTVRAQLVRRHWAQKHINRPLGQWQHVIFCDESRFMLFRIDNRTRVRRLVVEAMNEDCMWLTEAVLYMYGVVSLICEKPPFAFRIRHHWSRLSPSSGGTLGSTWQGMVTKQLATGGW